MLTFFFLFWCRPSAYSVLCALKNSDSINLIFSQIFESALCAKIDNHGHRAMFNEWLCRNYALY